VSLICTEVFLWLTHQNLDYPENFWCNVRNWGGIAPTAPLATRLHSAQFIITPQDKQPLKTYFYLELTPPQENVLLNLLAQKYCLQYQTISNFQPPLPLKWNLRNTSYMKKIPNSELKQHFTCPEQNTVYSSIL